MATSYINVAPFPGWSGMMTYIWQHKAKQLWLESGESVSKKMEEKVMNSWMMTMGKAWKELGDEQPDYQSRKHWREAVINCCSKVSQSSEEKNSHNDHNDHIIDKDAQGDASRAEGGKQDDTKAKRKMWRKTMKKCWIQAVGKHAKKEKMRECGSMKNRLSDTDYKEQCRKMMGQIMNGNCQTSLQEMEEKKMIMKKRWQKQQQKNDKKTHKRDGNKSPKREVNTEYRPNIIYDETNNINMKGGRYYYIKTQHHLNISVL